MPERGYPVPVGSERAPVSAAVAELEVAAAAGVTVGVAASTTPVVAGCRAGEYRAGEYRAGEYRAGEYRAREYRAREYRATAAALLGVGLALTTGTWAWFQQVEPYLGHDESVYAAQARSWLTGQPATGWEVYRPVGLPALARVALGAVGAGSGVATATVRAVGLVLALLTLVVVHAVGSRLIGRPRASVAVLVVVGGVTFLRRLPEFLDDIPSAGLLLLAGYLVLRSRRTGVAGAAWSLPLSGVVAVAACLVRYGASAGLLSIALAGVLAWGPRVWLRAWREVGTAAAVVVAGLAPLAVHGARVTGSPFGVVLRAAAVAHRRYPGEGLVYYVTAFPYALAGPLGGLVMAAGLVGVVAAGRRLHTAAGSWTTPPRRVPLVDVRVRPPVDVRVRPLVDVRVRPPVEDRGWRLLDDRERVFLGTAAVIDLVLLGLIAHGEGRFALFSMLVLIVLGTDTLLTAATGRVPGALPGLVVAAVAAWAVTAVLIAGRLEQVTAVRASVADATAQAFGRPGPSREPVPPPVLSAGRPGEAAAGTPTGPCLVVTGSAPEAGWLSGCDARRPDAVHVLPDDLVVYVIDFPGVGDRPGLARIRGLDPRRTWTIRTLTTTGRYPGAVLAVSSPLLP
jgi:hypothetical protein